MNIRCVSVPLDDEFRGIFVRGGLLGAQLEIRRRKDYIKVNIDKKVCNHWKQNPTI